MRSVKYFILVFILYTSPGWATDYKFDFNGNCQKAYRQYMSLQQGAAEAILKQELIINPNNLIPVYLADYGDCLQLLFNGSHADFELWKGRQEERLDQLEKGDENSPWYRFCKANIYLHWALVHIRFGDNFKAANKFRKSYILLKENRQKFPKFEENKILLGLEQAVAGAVPDSYKWIAAVFGVKGDINKGVSEIVSYLNAHSDGQGIMSEEAIIYYSYLRFYLLSQPELAWNYINTAPFDEQNNLMHAFIKSNLALNYRKADVALKILKSASGINGYATFPIMDYELAEALLLKLDFSCVTIYQRFIKDYRGKHFVKDAWQKMAWAAYLQNNITRSGYCVQQIKKSGNAATDADKQAQRFSESGVWPMRELLEIRLLIDGGYYKNALIKIQTINKANLVTVPNKLEYNFRYGRIFEELGNSEKAILFYKATVEDGRERTEYFAARAALQMALMLEHAGKKTDAIACFKDCLSMHNHDFQSSIDQQAKAGLNRLGN
jgi:hypothetical protein